MFQSELLLVHHQSSSSKYKFIKFIHFNDRKFVVCISDKKDTSYRRLKISIKNDLIGMQILEFFSIGVYHEEGKRGMGEGECYYFARSLFNAWIYLRAK